MITSTPVYTGGWRYFLYAPHLPNPLSVTVSANVSIRLFVCSSVRLPVCLSVSATVSHCMSLSRLCLNISISLSKWLMAYFPTFSRSEKQKIGKAVAA